jgi:hypothetical protein
LSPRRPGAGDCVLYDLLKFQDYVLNVKALALRMLDMLIPQAAAKLASF